MSGTSSSLLWSRSADVGAPVVPDSDLESYYYYPEPLDKVYVRLNYISSLTGKISADGRSGPLGTNIDKLVFGRLRRQADVILVGAGTVRAEGYRGARSSQSLRAERRERGQVAVPQIAVVTSSADLDPDSPFFLDTLVPPLILTSKSAPSSNIARLMKSAEIEIAGTERVDIKQALDALASRNLCRVLCEGGPSLFGQLFAADAVDEVCLTLAPKIGGSGRVSEDSSELLAMRIESVLTGDDTLLIRYRRAS